MMRPPAIAPQNNEDRLIEGVAIERGDALGKSCPEATQDEPLGADAAVRDIFQKAGALVRLFAENADEHQICRHREHALNEEQPDLAHAIREVRTV